jgi:plasmid replication initiation protein
MTIVSRVGRMTVRRDPNTQFDFFIPLVRDLPLKDQRETMERPFFSLQKRKRLKPIEYRSGDGEVWVKVEAVPAYGMASIWDADILVWAASSLNRLKAMGRNDLPRELRTTTYDLLRSIRRDTGGKGYQELRAALDRLTTTTIFTSIRAKRGRDSRFSWLDSWEIEVDPVTEKPTALKITLSNWVYEGIVNEKSLLTMHQDYFLITGGLERALYRIARKHAGDQETGWTCRVSLLREKSGSDSAPKEFNRMLRKIVEANEVPEYELAFVGAGDGTPAVHFIRRAAAERAQFRAELAAEDAIRSQRIREDARALEIDSRLDRFAHRQASQSVS